MRGISNFIKKYCLNPDAYFEHTDFGLSGVFFKGN